MFTAGAILCKTTSYDAVMLALYYLNFDPRPHLVQFLQCDGVEEVAGVVVDLPHTAVVGVQRAAQLRLNALAHLQ